MGLDRRAQESDERARSSSIHAVVQAHCERLFVSLVAGADGAQESVDGLFGRAKLLAHREDDKIHRL